MSAREVLKLQPLRSVVEGIAWPAIAEDSGAHLLATCFQLDRSQWWPPDLLRKHQLMQFHELLSHAVKTVAHYGRQDYRRYLNATGDDAWSAFRALPILTRREAQRLGDALRAASLPQHHGAPVEGQTSGSTGMPLPYWTTPLSKAMWNAVVMRDHFWQRRDFSARQLFIRGAEDAALAATWGPPSSVLFSAGESAAISPRRTAAEQLYLLLALDPEYLMATPVTVRSLAKLVLARGLPRGRLQEIRTVGETVTDSLRQLVFEVWGARLVDIYSSSECGMLALQCPLSGDYHSQSEAAIVEVIDENGKPCEPGQIGRVIVTPLHNFAMPLIRYDTGDFAESGGPCRCGRGLPTLKRILGRRRNRLHLPDGNTTWPNLSTMPWHELAPVLERFQLYQEKDFSLVFRYEAGDALSGAAESRIQTAMAGHLRYGLPLSFERVDGFPTMAAGKLEDFVSSIDSEPEAAS